MNLNDHPTLKAMSSAKSKSLILSMMMVSMVISNLYVFHLFDKPSHHPTHACICHMPCSTIAGKNIMVKDTLPRPVVFDGEFDSELAIAPLSFSGDLFCREAGALFLQI